jgi:hypothetical protein
MNKGLTRLTIAVLFLFPLVDYTQGPDLSGRVAFASLSTGKLVKEGAPLDEFAPRVLLRFTKEGSSSRFLVMTGADGTAFIPIEVGTYCVEAFGLDGHAAKMSARSLEPIHRCFTAVAGRTVEFSITLDAGAKYGGTVPPLGVE